MTEAALETEIKCYIDESPAAKKRRNGHTCKTIKSTHGSFELETPRDRCNEFEPQIIKENQTKLSKEIDSKIISLFGLGMSYRDIQSHIANIYGLDVCEGAITAITDKLIPELKSLATTSFRCRLSLRMARCHSF